MNTSEEIIRKSHELDRARLSGCYRFEEGLNHLDRDLSLKVGESFSFKDRPFLAFAYLSGESYHNLDFVQFQPEFAYKKGSSREVSGNQSFPCAEAILAEAVPKLDRQSGLAKRTEKSFSVRTNVLIHSPKSSSNQVRSDYRPVITLLQFAVSEDYVGNKKHRSRRAMRDLTVIGREALKFEFDRTEKIPFWVESTYGFYSAPKREGPFISAIENRMFNLEFINRVRGYRA